MKIQPGTDIGRYHILEQLGEGGMAVVYKAYDTHLESEVAIKVIRAGDITPNALPRILKRFHIEARKMAQLTHPNIVPVIDYGEFEGSPYLVMRYLPGGTLKERLGNPMGWEEAIRILLPIADALGYAHSKGIIHRDIKPSNILITQTGQPMLSDFGVAKVLESEETLDLTTTGMGIGTPEYMAPEIGIQKGFDHRADIYSLGIVLYELVTGRKPYLADTPLAVMLKHASEPLPRPKVFKPDLPDMVERILLKALAKDPADRYHDMHEVSAAFETALRDSPAAQTVHTKEKESAQPAPAPAGDRTMDDAGQKRKGKFLFWVLGIAGAAVILAAVLVTKPWETASPGVGQESSLDDQAVAIPVQYTENTNEIILSTSAIDGMEMVYIPAGAFAMGSEEGEGEADEHPVHMVNLDAYWMDRTEVTNAQYRACVEAGSCSEPVGAFSFTRQRYYDSEDFRDFPVVNVAWDQAKTYCEWSGRRLPTEAEWEKAARGTDGRRYTWGNGEPGSALLNYDHKEKDTTPVGSYPIGASPYGALDMAGNVWEWVADWYEAGYYARSPQNDPKGSHDGPDRVLRGGSWNLEEKYGRTTERWRLSATTRDNSIGFRCAMDAGEGQGSVDPTLKSPSTDSGNETDSAYSVGSTLISPKDGMILVYVPEGEFEMGDGSGGRDEEPAHTVYLDAFWIDQTEVTSSQFGACVNAAACNRPLSDQYDDHLNYFDLDEYKNHPVIYVEWDHARDYCKWVGRRLPTEAEWEKAARGTDGRIYPWGNQSPSADLVTFNFTKGPLPVASIPAGASPHGALDMAGNVKEWVADWYDSNYYEITPVTNPPGPSSGYAHVIRGGSYDGWNWGIRAATRYYGPMYSVGYIDYYDVGFRCAMDAE